MFSTLIKHLEIVGQNLSSLVLSTDCTQKGDLARKKFASMKYFDQLIKNAVTLRN